MYLKKEKMMILILLLLCVAVVYACHAGLSYPDLYQKCRECFYVNSDVALRAQLTEFCDHKLVRIKKVHS